MSAPVLPPGATTVGLNLPLNTSPPQGQALNMNVPLPAWSAPGGQPLTASIPISADKGAPRIVIGRGQSLPVPPPLNMPISPPSAGAAGPGVALPPIHSGPHHAGDAHLQLPTLIATPSGLSHSASNSLTNSPALGPQGSPAAPPAMGVSAGRPFINIRRASMPSLATLTLVPGEAMAVIQAAAAAAGAVPTPASNSPPSGSASLAPPSVTSPNNLAPPSVTSPNNQPSPNVSPITPGFPHSPTRPAGAPTPPRPGRLGNSMGRKVSTDLMATATDEKEPQMASANGSSLAQPYVISPPASSTAAPAPPVLSHANSLPLADAQDAADRSRSNSHQLFDSMPMPSVLSLLGVSYTPPSSAGTGTASATPPSTAAASSSIPVPAATPSPPPVAAAAAAPAPAASAASSGIQQKCDVCRTAAATIFCDTCSNDDAIDSCLYCGPCEEQFHAPKKVRFHFRMPLKEKQMASSATQTIPSTLQNNFTGPPASAAAVTAASPPVPAGAAVPAAHPPVPPIEVPSVDAVKAAIISSPHRSSWSVAAAAVPMLARTRASLLPDQKINIGDSPPADSNASTDSTTASSAASSTTSSAVKPMSLANIVSTVVGVQRRASLPILGLRPGVGLGNLLPLNSVAAAAAQAVENASEREKAAKSPPGQQGDAALTGLMQSVAGTHSREPSLSPSSASSTSAASAAAETSAASSAASGPSVVSMDAVNRAVQTALARAGSASLGSSLSFLQKPQWNRSASISVASPALAQAIASNNVTAADLIAALSPPASSSSSSSAYSVAAPPFVRTLVPVDPPTPLVGAFHPWYITLFGGNQMFVSDKGNDRVICMDRQTGKVLQQAGGLKAENRRASLSGFAWPSGTVLNSAGDLLYCADVNHRVHCFNASNLKDVKNVWSKDNGLTVQFPRGVAFTGNKLFVCDCSKHRLVAFEMGKQAKQVATIGSEGTSPGQFRYPQHLCVANEMLLVSDEHRVQTVSLKPPYKIPGAIGNNGELKAPTGVAFQASTNRIYVADSQASAIVVFDAANGKLIERWGSKGNGESEFDQPSALAISDDGLLFVCDSANHRISVFNINKS